MVSRREFLSSAGALGAAVLSAMTVLAPQQADAQALNPKQVPKFVNTLPNPLAPGFLWQPDAPGGTSYTLEIQQFSQSLGLGAAVAPTTVWGYGKAGQPGTASFPGRTFELQRDTTIPPTGITVTYENSLASGGSPLPNPMPVDLTLDWASPGAVGGITPVPLVTHLHGGDVLTPEDGNPDAWGTPFADPNAPTNKRGAGFQQGRLYTKPFKYDNAQEAGTLWYHDHALGITRTNVYMGLAGFYLLRDANENTLRGVDPTTGTGPVTGTPVLPSYPYEVPIVVQDREFTNTGQLFYPAGVNPVNSHLPEFFGRVILANGQAWPKLNVEPRKYRFRMLNGSDSRFYDLRFEAFAPRANVVPGKGRVLPILVVGDELGLLDNATLASLDTPVGGVRPVPPTPNVLALGTGERYDIVVDFTGLAPGSRVVMTNTARSPYPDAAKPAQGLTDRIMAFDVNLALSGTSATVAVGTDLRTLNPDLGPVTIPAGATVRKILLFEGTDAFGRLQTMLGPVDPVGPTAVQGTLTYKDPITETPTVGSTEVWEFYNSTVDAHPMHMHLVDFRVIDRQTFTGVLTPKVNSDASNGAILNPASIVKTGAPVVPGAWEAGRKDTVKLFPGEVTRILVSFNRLGEYVYHCHILSHEDHEMMRPYEVVP